MIAAVLAVFSFQASAQNICGARDEVIDKLFKSWGEVLFSQGLAMDNTLIETFVNPEKRTWTVIISDPSGRSCVASAGQNYEVVEPEAKPGKTHF